MNKWWGYLHTNGGLHVKRYFDEEDISEAHESPFVWIVAGPWECADHDEALVKLKAEVKGL
jgi:hypothetical protein